MLSLKLWQLLLQLLQLSQLLALMAAGLAQDGELRDVLALLLPGAIGDHWGDHWGAGMAMGMEADGGKMWDMLDKKLGA